jgi:hypothetical protein
MIQISLSMALIVYSIIVLVGAFGIWLYTEVTTRRGYLVLEKQYLWRCVFCSYTYLDADAVKHSECPQCHSINSMDDKQARFVPPAGALEQSGEAEAVQQATRHNPSKGKKKGARRRGPRRRSR